MDRITESRHEPYNPAGCYLWFVFFMVSSIALPLWFIANALWALVEQGAAP